MSDQWIAGLPKCPGCGRRLTRSVYHSDPHHFYCNYADCKMRVRDLSKCFVIETQYRFVSGPHMEEGQSTAGEHWYAPGYGLVFNADWNNKSLCADADQPYWWHRFSHTRLFRIMLFCFAEDPSDCERSLFLRSFNAGVMEVRLNWHWTDEVMT